MKEKGSSLPHIASTPTQSDALSALDSSKVALFFCVICFHTRIVKNDG